MMDWLHNNRDSRSIREIILGYVRCGFENKISQIDQWLHIHAVRSQLKRYFHVLIRLKVIFNKLVAKFYLTESAV